MKEIKIYEIPNIDFVERIDDPYIGMIFYVADIDTYYSVKTLKEINGINMKGSKVVEYVIDEYADFGTGSGGGSGLTPTQLSNIAKIPAIQSTVDALPNNYASKNHNHSEYASSSHRHNASEIDNLPSGGGVSQEDINTAVNNYLTEHPVQSGATAEQAAQITKNKDSISDIINNKLDGHSFKFLTQAEYDNLSEEEKNNPVIEYHITDAIDDLSLYQLKRDDALTTTDKTIVGAINEIRTIGLGNSNGTFKNIYANNDMPTVFITSDTLTNLTSKADGNANCEFEIRFKNQIIKCFGTGAVQGTSSAAYPAKNYTFKFYSDKENTTKFKIDVGWGLQNKYCFKKNWVDSTHTRNLSGARIAYDMVNSRPESDFKTNLLSSPHNGSVDGFPTKVYVNGEFWGLYTWNIPKDPWMFNMSDNNPTHMVLCAEYNNNGDNSQNNTCEFRSPWGGESDANWSIEVGTYSETLKNSFNNAISHVMNSSDENFKANFGNYFDLYSMLDYYCFSYLTAHIDGLGKNMLMATYDGVHWGACLYDMDSIYGADWNGASFKSATIKCPEEYQETNSLLWQRIVTNFSRELYDRYFELRNGALSLGNIINHVEEIYDLVPDRVFNDDRQKWTGIPSQTTNTITRFRNYMRDRAAYCDERFKELILDKSVTAVSISGNSEVKLGSSITLTANLTPSIANIRTGSWSVNNANVTLNNSNGLSVVVNGSVLGSSTITFTSDDTTNGTISATHDINVVETSSGPSGDYEAELILQPVMAGDKTWDLHSASTSSDCTGFECMPSFTYFDFPEDTSSMDTSYMYCSESIPVVTESEKKTNNIPCVAGALDAKTSPRKEYITLKLSNSDASNLDQLKTYLTNNITTLKVNMKSEVLKYTFNMDNITISTTGHSKPGYVCGEFVDNSCPITTSVNNVASASFMAGLPSNPDWSGTPEYSYFKITDWNGNRYIGFQIAENLLETQDMNGIKKFISKNPTLFYIA